MLTKLSLLLALLLLVPVTIVLVPATIRSAWRGFLLLHQGFVIWRDRNGQNAAAFRREVGRFGQQGAETRRRRRRRGIRVYMSRHMLWLLLDAVACAASLSGLAIIVFRVGLLRTPLSLGWAMLLLGCTAIALASVAMTIRMTLRTLRRRAPRA